jgi:hypothetical protein
MTPTLLEKLALGLSGLTALTIGALILSAPHAFFAGYGITLGDDEGRAVNKESHLEMPVALVMLARRDVVHLETQVPYPRVDVAGRARTHYFDFRLVLRDGSRVALIVKPAKTARFRETGASIAAQVTPDIANRVRIMTDRHVDTVDLHNAELLHGCRTPDPTVDDAARRLIGGQRGSVGPVFMSSTVARLRHFATVLGLIPSSRLSCASEVCDRRIAALTACVVVAQP